MKQPDLAAFRLLAGAFLSLVLICWVSLAGILLHGFVWGVIVYGLVATALSSTVVVITIPVLVRGTGKERFGAFLLIPLPLLVFIWMVWWVMRSRW